MKSLLNNAPIASNKRKPLQTNSSAFKARLLWFNSDPSLNDHSKPLSYFEDGLLVVKDGIIVAVGGYQTLAPKVEELIGAKTIVTTFKENLILPGFIDLHTHYPQVEIIASFSKDLDDWINSYALPAEMKYKNKSYSSKMAQLFLQETLRNGTTTALVFATSHKVSVDALFEAASKIKMRLICGKALMDRNAPKELLDDANLGFEQSLELIQKWHKHGRLLYAATLRFAPSSTKNQLQKTRNLCELYPDIYFHTHLAENKTEVDWALSLFPKNRSYLDIYDSFGLVGSRSIFAHSIYVDGKDLDTIFNKKASIAFCPSSNLFLGSGLFRLRDAKSHKVNIGIGTDIGAGTSFNMLKTLCDAYKVTQLQQSCDKHKKPLTAFEAFYHATLGGAKALKLDDKIGRLEAGFEADFVVLDSKATKLQKIKNKSPKNRMNKSALEQLEDELFALMILGDDRNIISTFVNGEEVYRASS